MIDKDEYINQFKKMTDSVHKNGANIIAQISIIRDFDMTVEEIHRIINLNLISYLQKQPKDAKKQDLMV